MDTTLINKITYSEFFGEKYSYRKQKSILLCDKFIKVSQNKILRTIISSLDYLYEKNPQFLSQ